MIKYKDDVPEIDDITILDPEGTYTYADYLRWSFEERVELIKGKLFRMSPAPKLIHQEVHSRLYVEIGIFVKGKSCKLYSAPFDVRLPGNSEDSELQTMTVVQPDLCVVCDSSKLDDFGCKGAPDLIVEILSPSTSSIDLNEKYELYEEHGVREYWVVYPGEGVLELFRLQKGKYVTVGKFTAGDVVTSQVLKGLKLELKEVFSD